MICQPQQDHWHCSASESVQVAMLHLRAVSFSKQLTMASTNYTTQAPDKKCSPCSCLLCPWHGMLTIVNCRLLLAAVCCLFSQRVGVCRPGLSGAAASSWIVFETSAPLSIVQ